MFVLAFDKSYLKMGKALINALNYFHSFPKIKIYTTDYLELCETLEGNNVQVIDFVPLPYNYADWHPLIWAKIEAFNLDSKETQVFMDVDIIMYSPLTKYIEEFNKSGCAFAAAEDDDPFFFQFKKIPEEFDFYKNNIALNTGLLIRQGEHVG